jgi:hypothetical protein
MWWKRALAFSVAIGALQAAEPFVVGLVYRNNTSIPAEVARAFERETESGIRRILATPSVRVAWRPADAAIGGEVFDRLIVVRFDGDCSLQMMHLRGGRGPLGSTSVSDGKILPFIDINCDRTKATLARIDSLQHALIPSGVLGRALSHIALHEIYHVLSDRPEHDAGGMFKAQYSAGDLLDPGITRLRVPDLPGPSAGLR